MNKILYDTLTFAEASEMWGLDHTTIRKMINTDKLTKNKDYRKSGNVWLIKKEAMEKVYGPSNFSNC